MAVKLTNASEIGKPPMPITLNPLHVVELKPRYRPKPNQGSQTGGLLPGYEGCTAVLVTGERINLLEDYADAHEKLWPSKTELAASGLALPQDLPSIPQSQVKGLTVEEPEENRAEPLEAPAEDAPPPAKKAPAKKAGKPQLLDSQETINKITVLSDEPIEEKDEA